MKSTPLMAALAGLSLLAALPAAAHSVKLGPIEISDLWTQAVPPGAPTATAYFTIENKGTEPDRLVAAASADAERGELHEMSMEGGIMRMRPLAKPLEIPPGGRLVLADSGVHVMLIGLKRRPPAGDKLPLTLTFAKAGTVETFLHVVPIGSKPPAEHSHDAVKGDAK